MEKTDDVHVLIDLTPGEFAVTQEAVWSTGSI
jgi:hypothetical protein